jgi:ribonucleoside-diphosphate reductase beta chain
MEPEFILQEENDRYCLFPIQHKDIWDMYKTHLAAFWTAEEIDLSEDTKDWETLSFNEKHFVKMVLAFFANSDGIVLENLGKNFLNDVKLLEAKCFYGFQMAMENIHNETYSLLIDTLIEDQKEKDQLFDAIENFDCIKKKANWAIKWTNKDTSFAERLVAFAAVEGIFFSGSFCSIFWLKKRNLMPGLTFSNELISRDEGLHTQHACLLYSKLKNKLTQKKVYEIIEDAVNIEEEFICDALPVNLIGMNSKSMRQYIKYVADDLLQSLGYKKLYKVSNPFDWMDMISMQGKTNFFEKRVGDYQKVGVKSERETDIYTFDEELM